MQYLIPFFVKFFLMWINNQNDSKFWVKSNILICLYIFKSLFFKVYSWNKQMSPLSSLTSKSKVKYFFHSIQDGEEVFFKIKATTQLKKLMDAYCQRQSVHILSISGSQSPT